MQINGVSGATAAPAVVGYDAGSKAIQTAQSTGSQANPAQTNTASSTVVASGNSGGQASNAQGVQDAVNKLNNMTQALNVGLQFSVDPSTKTNVVKVMDMENQQVIRQIPSEEAISIAQAIDRFQGLLVRSQA